MPVADKELSVAELAKKTYLIPAQRQQIEESVAHLNFMIHDPETREVAVPNTDRLVSNLRREEQMLEEGTPPEYDPLTRNKLNRLRLKLEEDIQRGMPTSDMMEKPTPNNVDLHIWWERENVQRVAAWKAICRTLDPHNIEPNFTNIARLRPSTPPSINPRKYWQNFDAVSWQEGIDQSLYQDELDDDVYHTFLELKLLDWTKVGICKELALTPALYEAAMQRLRASKAAKRTVEKSEEPPPEVVEKPYRIHVPDEELEEEDVEEEDFEEEEEDTEDTSSPEKGYKGYITKLLDNNEDVGVGQATKFPPQTWIEERARAVGISLHSLCKLYPPRGNTQEERRHTGLGGPTILSSYIKGSRPIKDEVVRRINAAFDDYAANKAATKARGGY